MVFSFKKFKHLKLTKDGLVKPSKKLNWGRTEGNEEKRKSTTQKKYSKHLKVFTCLIALDSISTGARKQTTIAHSIATTKDPILRVRKFLDLSPSSFNGSLLRWSTTSHFLYTDLTVCLFFFATLNQVNEKISRHGFCRQLNAKEGSWKRQRIGASLVCCGKKINVFQCLIKIIEYNVEIKRC